MSSAPSYWGRLDRLPADDMACSDRVGPAGVGAGEILLAARSADL